MKMIPFHLPFPLYHTIYTVDSFVVWYKSSANNYRYSESYFPVFDSQMHYAFGRSYEIVNFNSSIVN